MADIKINYPKIEINVIEIDEYLPSFKLSLHHNNEGLNFKNNFYCEFWVETKKWDLFIDSINEKKVATLVDMSNNERISIKNSDIILNLSQNSNFQVITLINKYSINEEDYNIIISKFLYFSKWW